MIIVAASCSQAKQPSMQAGNDSTVNRDYKETKDQLFTLKEFRDTTLNGITLTFRELTDEDYNSLKQQIRETALPLQFSSHLVSTIDSCLLIKLENGKTDSLCNKRQRDYFEQFTFRGLWEQNGLVLLNYADWEGGSDFFIKLDDGDQYYLTNNYKAAPDLKHILSFVDLNEAAFVPSGLMLTECDNRKISTKLNIEFKRVLITSLSWLTNDQCLISAGDWDAQNYSVNNLKNFKLTLRYN
jgi:hypothetical protein